MRGGGGMEMPKQRSACRAFRTLGRSYIVLEWSAKQTKLFELFVLKYFDVSILDSKLTNCKNWEINAEFFKEQQSCVEVPSEESYLKQISVNKATYSKSKLVSKAQFVNFQIAFVVTCRQFVFLTVKVGYSDHSFDDEHRCLESATWIEVPQTIADELSHWLKIFWWKLKCWQQKVSSDNCDTFQGFFVGFTTQVVPKIKLN